MKSQPFKLQKVTILMAVPGGYCRFLQLVVTSTYCCPLSHSSTQPPKILPLTVLGITYSNVPIKYNSLLNAY
ncbi:hypothetical protein Hanom_Chr11g01035231 [Helianthus anomalus]